MPRFNEIADRYIAMFNEPDDGVRRRRVEELFTEDAVYIMFNNYPFVGHDAIFKQVTVSHRIYVPLGFRFASSHNAVGHHNLVRFGWVLLSADTGDADMMGSDVLVLAPDDRVSADYQFHDRVSSVPYDRLRPVDELFGDVLNADELARYREAFANVGRWRGAVASD
ncbi:MAG TPA: hypothetical protein VFW65_06575 [Pseudonocardiaceae bacterium]|nr:hypothetical protein [Pseudonocardiaceae bacterium]